ncbi:MAG TPA: mechanosensitive ion channel family protein [Candidatus Fraserbacteria bacterium]|nr:mechanosensitive ion channel family protein [Candidatus Fraserbacteria bacterium]
MSYPWTAWPDWAVQALSSLVILGGTLLIARLLILIFTGLLGRWARQTRTELDDRLLTALRGPLYALVWLGGIYLVLARLSVAFGLGSAALAYLGDGAFSLAVLLGGYLSLRVIAALLEGLTSASEKLPSDFLFALRKVVAVFVWTIFLTILLSHFGIDINALIATLGVSSLAIALAFQDTIANMIAGFLLMADRPFRVGDLVKLSSGETGRVLDIGIRRTKLLTPDYAVLIVPNLDLSKSRTVNYSYPEPRTRLRFLLTVPQEQAAELQALEHSLRGWLSQIAPVRSDPPPLIALSACREAQLDLRLDLWIDDYAQRESVSEQILRALKRRLDEQQLSFALKAQG